MIHIMDSTGYCQRRLFAAELYPRAIITTGNPRSGSARRPFNRLLQWEIIEALNESPPSTGRWLEFLRPTARGREAHRRLFGREAVESEYDRLLRWHRSPQHGLLNLQATKALKG